MTEQQAATQQPQDGPQAQQPQDGPQAQQPQDGPQAQQPQDGPQAQQPQGQTPPPGYQQGYYQGPYPPPPYKRLTRTSWDAPISGVCGGVARYFGVDPTLIRVLAVIAAVVTFPVGLIAYAVAWAVMPKE